MTPGSAALVAASGIAAGFVNAVVGAGTLLSFPALLAAGLPPVVANATNAVGLVPGSLGGAWGYRRELAGQARRAAVLSAAAAAGAVAGAALLLVLPAAVFRAVVPWLIVGSCLLVIVQPPLRRRVEGRRDADRAAVGRPEAPSTPTRPAVAAGVAGTGVYGGYFGAGQSVVLLGVLGLLLPDGLQRLNGLKNVLTAAVNATAGVIFIATGNVRWPAALLLAAGALVGGALGGTLGRRLPERALRAVVVAVGVAAAAVLVVTS